MKRAVIAILLLATPFALPEGIFAHAFGQQYTLTIPVWIFLYGVALAVALSFIVIGLLVGNKKVQFRSTPLSKNAVIGALTGRVAIFITRVIMLGLFLLLIVSGYVGVQDTSINIGPTQFWIVFLLGYTYLTAIIGNSWSVISPLRVITEAWEKVSGSKTEGLISYPKWLSYWPALLFYFLLIYNELLSGGQAAIPRNLSNLVLEYSVLTMIGVLLFGRDTWFKYGEFLNVFFGLVGKVSPLYWDKGQLRLRAPFIGLLGGQVESLSQLIFVIFMLASTAYDGFRATSSWFQIDLGLYPYYQVLGPNGFQIFSTLSLVLAPLLFLTVYLLLVLGMKIVVPTKLSTWELAKKFGLSLVPIAIAYNIAHYFGLLLVQGQAIWALISDPFGLGWNIFGTAAFFPNVGLIRADFIWYAQVFFIVSGHIAAVYLAHIVATQVFPRYRQAVVSQLPMLVLMVSYTLTGLWILSQPFNSKF
jgi:hypothetical protein